MFLLYILWDDWPISMISSSNEHLQHQLEYTLLKTNCHSWLISNMLSKVGDRKYSILIAVLGHWKRFRFLTYIGTGPFLFNMFIIITQNSYKIYKPSLNHIKLFINVYSKNIHKNLFFRGYQADWSPVIQVLGQYFVMHFVNLFQNINNTGWPKKQNPYIFDWNLLI